MSTAGTSPMVVGDLLRGIVEHGNVTLKLSYDPVTLQYRAVVAVKSGRVPVPPVKHLSLATCLRQAGLNFDDWLHS